MTRVAAIDIGTNSVLLVVAEQTADGVRPLVERATITRLGQGVDRTRQLAPEARQRTLDCLSHYAADIERAGVARLDVVGTSAMRDASGGEQFVREAERILGRPPRVIAGSEEARLTFIGSLSGLDVDGEVIVFDVGGGSTEIIVGKATRDLLPHVERERSLDIGSVRLFERHVASDPPEDAQLKRARADIVSALSDAPAATAGARLIGVAGTVTTLAAIEQELDDYDAGLVHGARLTRDSVDALALRLASQPLASRKMLPGLQPERADVIVTGALIVSEVMRWASAATLTVSDRGVRWGLVQQLLGC